jgi:hypothetical protein
MVKIIFNYKQRTDEDDEILMNAVTLYGERNWQQVADCFGNFLHN